MPLTDNAIRQKAKETARLLHIPEEKFKASSGWIENFKSRHGIRGGVWSGAKKNPYPGHILNDVAPEPALSPLNPAFDGRPERISAFPVDSHDVDLESNGSPEPDELHPPPDQNMVQAQAHSMVVQPSWPERHSDSSPMEQSASAHSGQLAEHSQPPSSIHLPPLSTQQHVHQHAPEPDPNHQAHLSSYVDSSAVYYHHPSAAPIPEPRPPTLADAEDAINTLITFLDSTGQGILEEGERDTLNTIKCALFQAGSGIPFDRSKQ